MNQSIPSLLRVGLRKLTGSGHSFAPSGRHDRLDVKSRTLKPVEDDARRDASGEDRDSRPDEGWPIE